MESDLVPVPITPRKQDSAWNHCEVFKYGDRVQLKCIYCQKMFKGGGITRVKEHLAGKKGQGGPICDRVPPDVRLLMHNCLDTSGKRQRKKRKSIADPEPIACALPDALEPSVHTSDMNNGFDSAGPGPVGLNKNLFSSRTKQRTYRKGRKENNDDFVNADGGDKNLTDLVGDKDVDNPFHLSLCCAKNLISSSKDGERQIHMAIGRFLFDIDSDFDAVKSVNFLPMIAAVCGGQGISLPTQEDLQGWILKNSVEELKKDIDECKQIWKRSGCSILVEQWNTEKGLTLLNFLVYSPEKVVFLKSVDASKTISCSDQLYELLKQVVEEVGSADVVQVITRCEDNYVAAGKRLMDAYPLYWTPCAAHCIDMMLDDCGKLEWVREITKQAQSVTKFIYNRSAVLSMMHRFTSGNDIVQPGITQSATNFETLGCIADYKINLQDMVTSSEWNDSSFSKEAGGLAMSETINDQGFWNSCTLITRLTGPLLRVLRIVYSEKRASMGYVYVGLYRAKEAIKKEFVKREDYIVYWKIIDSRWEQQKRLPLHATGFFLNPKFFYNINEEMRSEILSDVFDSIERLVPDAAIQDKIIKEINLYKNAAGVFGKNLAIRARDTMLPAEWWSTYGEGCPNLSRFAIRILSQTCGVIGCKTHLISIEQAHKASNYLEHQRLSDLAFVQYNMRLKRIYGARENMENSVYPLSRCDMDVLEEWVARSGVCLEESGDSDWKSLEVACVKRNAKHAKDEAEDLGTSFDDLDIFKEYKEEGLGTSISEKLFA